ncbi:MAG: 3'(2'),5'-bisphosphate nucleotidase CysQ [Rudaea sp.]
MSDELSDLACTCCSIARAAGDAIMAVYAGDFAVERKDDDSPLTAADLAAHRTIVAGLKASAAQIPVLSEEAAEEVPWSERRTWSRYFLVDPLDGTREFVKRNGEFTVNIALIEDGVPTMGVVYAPVLDEMFSAWSGGNAWLHTARDGRKQRLHTRPRGRTVVVAGSRSHADPRLLGALERLGAHELITLGSSLKFCRTAQGIADLYLRYGLTSEWDTAAGQCVLEQAGGVVARLDGTRLLYNTKESLLNPDFMAYGDESVDWVGVLGTAREP